MRMPAVPFRASKIAKLLAAVAVLSAVTYAAEDLVFLTDATNPGNGLHYKAYLDKSSIHPDGEYQSAKLVAVYDEPFDAGNYKGIKSMTNTFEVDCSRHVKRVTYIAFLDSQGQIIVDQKYPDAKDEGIGANTVDKLTLPYLCGPAAAR
jgi:hypothetical protein